MAEALTARGHEVELITYHIADGPQPLGVPVHRIFRRPVYWRMPVGPSFRKLALYDPALSWKLSRVLSGSYAAVILDVMMPGMNGFDALRELRSRSRIPVLMLTALGDETDRIADSCQVGSLPPVERNL